MNSLQILQCGLALLLFVLLYAYFLFPLFIGLIGNQISPCDESGCRSPEDLPTLSLIIPAYNEEAVIEAKIRNSLALDYPTQRIEILVACDGTGDATAEISQRFREDHLKTLVFAQRRGKASVVNDAAARAWGEVLCFCDANVMFAPDALKRLVARLADPKAGAVSGDVQLQSEDCSFGFAESLYYKLERGIHQAESRLGSMMGVDGGMYVMRRELFQPLPADTILDDFTISMNVIRAGRQVLYEPHAIAKENATDSAVSELKRRIRMGAGVAQVLKRRFYPRISQPLAFWLFVSHKLLRWLSPYLLALLLVLVGYLSLIEIRYAAILGAGLLVLGLAAVGSVSEGLRRHWLFSVPFYFVLSQIGIGYGLLKGILTHQTAMWERTERESLATVGAAAQQDHTV